MDHWQNKVAVVTGASSGIGAAVAEDLIKAGLIVAALARRFERLQENQKKLPTNLQSNYHPVKCDVSKEDQVTSAFQWVEKELGGIDVLINNAGIAEWDTDLTTPENGETIRNIVDTNIMAVVYCVGEAFNSMKKRKFDGHIVILNSIAGHYVPMTEGFQMNIYPATKFAVTALTETYRQEFANAGTKVKVTSISPGVVETEILLKLENFDHPSLKPEDISNAILYVLGIPPHVQIHDIIIRPLGEKV